MRKSCIDCCKKHLGSASVIEDEIRNGYPAYELYFIGHLDQAASEMSRDFPRMSKVIREHRLKWMSDHSHDIPFEELWENLNAMSQMTDEELSDFTPFDVYSGIGGEYGEMNETGDTRP